MQPPKERVRAELLERLRCELVGPNDEQEVLSEAPTDRYLCGILWPAGSTVEGSELDTGDMDVPDSDDDPAPLEQTAPLAQAMKPSSIGVSFLLEPSTSQVRVRANWAVYGHEREGKQEQWVRKPVEADLLIALAAGTGRQRVKLTQDTGICLETITRVRQDKRVAVSLFLVNRKPKPKKGIDAPFCIFQPVLLVLSPEDNSAPFEVREMAPPPGVDRSPDMKQDDLLYRHEKAFAIGHNTAVRWQLAESRPDRAVAVETVTVPDYQVAPVIPPTWTSEQGGSLDMQELANASDGLAIADSLAPLLDAYDRWIFEQEQEIYKATDLTKEMRSQGEEHLTRCRQSLNRMRTGLDMITDHDDVLEAFQFANRAMARQRNQSQWAIGCKKAKDWSSKAVPVKSVWRPFQIGFILQALAGLVESTHSDRLITDLLWFPTGGGKTEAYLGLSAFIMGLRRLRREQSGMRGDAGVTVIMRYTLRLLTIQQFQRAATLICACEMLRKEDSTQWGDEPFRIGLWLGSGSTPNDYDTAEKVLKGEWTNSTGTPVQLVSCPWCGSALSEKHYAPITKSRRVLIGCSRAECDFHRTKNKEGIPALVVDEEIYRLAPSMVIGTVDKFARIPWLAETGALFGNVQGSVPGWGFVANGEGENTAGYRNKVLSAAGLPQQIADSRPLLPPDLIIQDELHLISGPLGTMVGAYETAVDLLCSREVNGKRIVPKVIASTATIRRSEEQIRGLFERATAVFPPPGITSMDSFFARQQPLSVKAGRLYVGIFAPPRSVKTALVRVHAALLASVPAIKEAPEHLDPYFTLVGYFNSLRELGGAKRLVEDDVRARIATLSNPKRTQRFPFVNRPLQQDIPELTSRVDSKGIPERLAELERVYVGKSRTKEPPVDVVLASNMISVGVDVGRLGLMVVTGQPKTTAEYIQATSRVGREHPGLVITVYNWARPRDLSHYERFSSYHAALYRYVEAISVTPFSSRARDRALAAAFIAMCRHKGKDLAHRTQAGKFRADDSIVQRLRQRLLDRAAYINSSLPAEVMSQLERIAKKWDTEAQRMSLVYSGGERTQKPLIYQLGEKKGKGFFAVPNSMRDVEKTVGLYVMSEGDE